MSVARSLRRGRLLPLAALALLLLRANNCYDEDDYSPTEPNINAIITLTSQNGETSLPADGLSRLRLVATLRGAPTPENRTILFDSNGMGTLVGGVADGESISVKADATGRAFIDFVAGQTAGTAIVTATPKSSPGLTVSLPLTLLPADPNAIIQFVRAPATAPADGATLTAFTVEVSPELPASTMIRFAASSGGFGSSGTSPVEAPVDDGHRASADLKSPAEITTVRVTATVQGVSRTAEIVFERALPDAITVTASDLQVPAALDTEVTITATLLRDIGRVTDGTVVTFGAVDDAGSPVGLFGNVTRSIGTTGNAATATATFLPRTEDPGFVTVTVGVEGSAVAGTVRIELTG